MAVSKNLSGLWIIMVLVGAFGLISQSSTAQAQGERDLCWFVAPPGFSCAGTIPCFPSSPVCGVNGVTYTCGCPEAACAGVRVVKRGP
ncbi:hypothetical protein Tsubulata_006918 [Turnera subulata]|uniref:Kazal-like domain-containing protein n=1 Tax=Turnera subulata TaxID=218843 RepID=A0A9Q0JNV4_9ROSI|nr:hypothetical protein Tsubulata_006918 [Turnera subulata]